MKKTGKKIMGIFLAGAVAVGAFHGTMAYGAHEPQLRLVDLKGDRSALDGFIIDGSAGDNGQSVQFTLENGVLTEKTLSCGIDAADAFVRAKRAGKGIGRYFTTNREADREVEYTTAEAITLGNSAMKKVGLEAVPEKDQKQLFWAVENIEEGQGSFYELEELPVFLDISGWRRSGPGTSNGTSQITVPSGLVLKNGSYYGYGFEDADVELSERNVQNFWASAAECENSCMAVLLTKGLAEGMVDLVSVEKADMQGIRNRTKAAGKDEYRVLKRFDVDEENYIFGIYNVDESHVLLIRLENGDTTVYELFNENGKIIDTKRRAFSEEELGGSETFYEPAEEGAAVVPLPEEGRFSFEVMDGCYRRNGEFFMNGSVWEKTERTEEQKERNVSAATVTRDAVQVYASQDGIRFLGGGERGGGFLDYQNGRVLYGGACMGEPILPQPVTGRSTGSRFTLEVWDDAAGNCIYKGEIRTDFDEDLLKELARVNIGKDSGYLSEREIWNEHNEREWSMETRYRPREFGTVMGRGFRGEQTMW